jgi:NADPH:quinone reductase-like Zn-dependent oxidoreductase
MQAAVFRVYGGPDVIDITDLPEPRLDATDQVLIEVHAVALNPLDTKIRRGELSLFVRQSWPARLGHDVYATVLACGNNVQHLQVGDQVAGFIDRSHCPSLMGFVRGGALAQRLVVRANTLCAIRGPVSPDVAALGLAGQTASQALLDKTHLQAGHKVLINGASGGVGSMAVQIAKQLGAEVTAVAGAEHSHWLEALGASHVLDYRTEQVLGDVRYDVIYDVVGVLKPAQARRCLEPGGILISNIPSLSGLLRASLSRLLPCCLPRFAVVWVKPNYRAMQRLLDWYAAGKIQPAVSARFHWHDVREAFEYMESPRSYGKTLVMLDGA